MENIVHDIRKFNANIKTKSTLIENKSKEKHLYTIMLKIFGL